MFNWYNLFNVTLESVNPSQSGIPADSKGVACWYFNTNWCWSFNTNYPMPRLWYCKKRQKRLTLRAQLRYLENSDQCIKFTSCSSSYAWSWSKNWGQSLYNLTLTELSKYCNFAAKSQNEKSTKGVAFLFKDRWGGPDFILFFAIFMVKTKLFWSFYKILKEWPHNLWPISDFKKNI